MVTRSRVLVAMSGGVDSSVAAWMLKDKGFEVVGVTMQIWPRADDDSKACCSLGAVNDARRVAGHLAIPHYVMNFRDEFKSQVVDVFAKEYLIGRTPNPCIECNRQIKFGSLLTKALAMGFDHIATGHYARIQESHGEYTLLTGIDDSKDQSYALYTMSQHQLAHTIFPLGEFRKSEVRTIAEKEGLPVAHKADSQEICFVIDGNYGDFVERYVGEVPGPGRFRLSSGAYLGHHRGIHRYTIGQRKGLGLALGQPFYVNRIDPDTGDVWLGGPQELLHRRLEAEEVSFVSGKESSLPQKITAKIRYSAAKAEASATLLDEGRLRIEFRQPQRAITPGQAVVLYEGERVLGGGRISEVLH